MAASRLQIEEHADVARWRSDTSAAATLVHLNNAGASLVPRPVSDAVAGHLRLEEELGGYEAADHRADGIEAAHQDIARLLGSRRRNVAIVESSTTAFSQALLAFDFRPGDSIVTTKTDYVSNQIMYLSLARRRGVRLVRAEDAPEGGVDLDSLRQLVQKHRPALVAVSWVPTSSGLVQPVAEAGAICEAAGIPYLVDACQAAGQLPIDVGLVRCDFLAGTSRKFLRGPRGSGFLYVSDRALDRGAHPLLVDMRGATWTQRDEFRLEDDARRFETWEYSAALVMGLGAAVRYALDVGIERGGGRARDLAAYARERMETLPGVRALDRGPELCAIATFDVAGRKSRELMLELRRRGINTSVSHRDDAVIELDEKGVSSALRVSPHYYNTAEEIDSLVQTMGEILKVRP